MTKDKAEKGRGSGGQDGERQQRRRFLTAISVGLGTVGAALAGVPVLGFILAPLLQKTPEVWQAVGTVDSFQVGQTVEVSFEDASPLPWAGVAAKTAAWLRRNSATDFTAFAVNCTHLGCPVRWLDGAQLFMCPCHGGVYNDQGQNVAGPPPQPLARYPVRISNGQVEIRTTPVPITTFTSGI
ncbi:MAG: ubiquinol-cytochrome c reductase iron-sulfur subunit [Caldilineaceae bacterium]|nr:ubiquinol-cytochrome c reductase iron-sulfur subunit [Caldilineaceae bacterium]